MNTVHTKTVEAAEHTATELIDGMATHGETAFVGRIGNHYGLFLITYEAIIQADYPRNTWNDKKCLVEVHHFCDVTITEV